MEVLFMKKIFAFLIALMVGAALAAGGMFYMNLKSQPQVDAKGLMERLEEASELTVAKNYYTGIVRFKEGKIPLISKNGFTMKYEAVIDAGFDLENVKIEVTDDVVTVTVPHSEIQSITIDPDSLEFYDNKTSLIKTDRKEATKKALQEAEKDAEKHATGKGILEEADKHAEVVFKGILADGVGNRQIVVVFDDEKDAGQTDAGSDSDDDQAGNDSADTEDANDAEGEEAESVE